MVTVLPTDGAPELRGGEGGDEFQNLIPLDRKNRGVGVREGMGVSVGSVGVRVGAGVRTVVGAGAQLAKDRLASIRIAKTGANLLLFFNMLSSNIQLPEIIYGRARIPLEVYAVPGVSAKLYARVPSGKSWRYSYPPEAQDAAPLTFCSIKT